MVSKKNYEAIARRINTSLAHSGNLHVYQEQGVARTARYIADAFKDDNPKFRYDIFFRACGLDEWGYLKD